MAQPEQTKQINLTQTEIDLIRNALKQSYKSALRAANNSEMQELKQIHNRTASQINNLINRMI